MNFMISGAPLMSLFRMKSNTMLCGQVCAKPKYSLVMYFVADKPIQPGSLLDQFANGDDAFRNSRFKLIPSIVEVSTDTIAIELHQSVLLLCS